MSTTPPPQPAWTNDLLDRMRGQADPLADQAVGQVFADGEIQAVNSLMQRLVENDGIPPDGLPDVIHAYLDQSDQLPEWADAALIKTGEDVFWKYGPQVIATLFCYSLPFCYAARKGVQVLWLTSRLYSNPTRRIIETAQMVVDVMRPGGLAAGGAGVRTAQKVRLMHAGVRRQIHAYQGWNPDFGEPINQEDMAGTLLSFSWVVVDGLRRLGIPVEDGEAEAYLHSWRVVGHILGIRPELMPTNMAGAATLAHTIQQRQYAACPEGQGMTAALIGMMQQYIPGNIFDSIPAALIRYLLGDANADLLAVEHKPPADVLIEPLRLIDAVVGKDLNASAPFARISEVFSRKLIDGIVWAGRGGKRIPFTIPTELRQAWGVNWTA
ncbi:MAG TPA: oxygenase MpaB family protein [Bryobacteraceae bacterium]|nr:oxygenase MpaB family protein [Bryobacteraceae bacterium]